MLSGFGGSLSIKETTSDAEDTGGETGAILLNSASVRASSETGRWGTSTSRSSVLRLAVEGSQRASGILASNYAQTGGAQEIVSLGDEGGMPITLGAADRYLIRGFSWLSDDTTPNSGGFLNPFDLRSGWTTDNLGGIDSTGTKWFGLIPTANVAGINAWTAPQGATVAGGATYMVYEHVQSRRGNIILTRFHATSSTNDDDPTAPDVSLGDAVGDFAGRPLMAFLGEPLVAMVQNLGQTNNPYASATATNAVLSQGFTTGSNATGYELQGIGVNIEGSDSNFPDGPTSVSVAVHADSGGKPGAKLFGLVSPTEFAAGHSFFEAPAGTTLAASTSYVLVWTHLGGASHRLQRTLSDNEDTDALTDFSIANVFYRGADVDNLTANADDNTLEIAVYGGLSATAATVATCSVAAMQNQVWTATLTVGEDVVTPALSLYGWNDSGDFTGASLSDEEFTFDGHTYNLDEISTGQLLFLEFSEFGDLATEATQNKLTLHVGSQSFNVGDATFAVALKRISWGSGFTLPTWAASDSVCLALTEVVTPAVIVTAPTVMGVSLTSAPGSDNTYGIGDSVAATVTFDAAVDITGTPQLELDFDGTAKMAACATGTNTTTMVCSYTVAVGDLAPSGTAPHGIAIGANKLTGGTITATGTTTAAVLTHSAVASNFGHKVDGIRPTLLTTGTDAPTTFVDGFRVHLSFSEPLGAVDHDKITIRANGADQPTSAAIENGVTVQVTLATALTTTSTNITVALAADAVKDDAGNGILAVAATAVTNAITAGDRAALVSCDATDAAITGAVQALESGGNTEVTDVTNLVADCTTLLRLKDELQGTVSLNWDPAIQMWSQLTTGVDWDGIRVSADLASGDRAHTPERGPGRRYPGGLGQPRRPDHLRPSEQPTGRRRHEPEPAHHADHLTPVLHRPDRHHPGGPESAHRADSLRVEQQRTDRPYPGPEPAHRAGPCIPVLQPTERPNPELESARRDANLRPVQQPTDRSNPTLERPRRPGGTISVEQPVDGADSGLAQRADHPDHTVAQS